MRADGFDIELIHRQDRSGFKAGALENGMRYSRGEYILILDADFVPSPDMLKKTIHYFTNPRIGMIQTRWGHLNRDYSLLTRVQAMYLDGHLLLEQTGRNRSGRFISFNGTAGLWRKSCVEDAGGWQHDTLTEDLDLSYRAQLNGWEFVFLPDLVTPAELPVEMNGFKSQQHRWTKGSIQTCIKLLPRVWEADLPLVVKLEATAHLTSNYAFLLLFCLCLLMRPSVGGSGTADGNEVLRLLLVDLPLLLTGSLPAVVFYLVSQRELNPRRWWREIVYLPALLAVTIGLAVNNARAVLEAIFGIQSEFTRTPKYGISSNRQTWRKAKYSVMKDILPFVELAFAVYFWHFVATAYEFRQWLSLPFLVLFALGFTYVSVCSLLHRYPQLRISLSRGGSGAAPV
jgi:glycosyltransferase involved in cell wall biosynthesis